MNDERDNRPARMTLEEVARLAKASALEHGGHVAMVIAEGSNRSVVGQLPELAATHEGRARQMFGAGLALGQRGEVGNLEQVFFVTEGWMSGGEGRLPQIPPSQDPNRKEVLVVSNFTVQERTTRMVILEMIRDRRDSLSIFRSSRRPRVTTSRWKARW